MKIERKCNVCGETVTIEASKKDLQDWQNGALIQNVLPYLTVDEREMLISGVCGTCFDRMFEED